MIKRIILAASILLITTAPLLAVNEALFTLVTGKVTVKDQKSKKSRKAVKGARVVEGEMIVTGVGSQADLKLFDGSEISVKPKTSLVLAKMRPSDLSDKLIQFKLLLGRIWSKVKKLSSSKSSFEIDAGGVLCGVRGTSFGVDYMPGQHKVDIQVDEGSVWGSSGGVTSIFTAGQSGTYLNGISTPNRPNGGNPTGQGVNQTDNGKGVREIAGVLGKLDALGDLRRQFNGGLLVNGNNNLTDPAVEGSVKLVIHINVSPVETLP